MIGRHAEFAEAMKQVRSIAWPGAAGNSVRIAQLGSPRCRDCRHRSSDVIAVLIWARAADWKSPLKDKAPQSTPITAVRIE